MALRNKFGAGFGSGSATANAFRRKDHYEAQVNKGKLNMGTFTAVLNDRWASGWMLNMVFEQDGNTVVIWERRPDDDVEADAEAVTEVASGGTPAGWYPANDGTSRQRYWDGTQWTEQFQG